MTISNVLDKIKLTNEKIGQNDALTNKGKVSIFESRANSFDNLPINSKPLIFERWHYLGHPRARWTELAGFLDHFTTEPEEYLKILVSNLISYDNIPDFISSGTWKLKRLAATELLWHQLFQEKKADRDINKASFWKFLTSVRALQVFERKWNYRNEI